MDPSLLHITDTTGQGAWLRASYVIGVLMPGLLSPGDGICRVVFVGGVITVTRSEATRVLEILEHAEAPDVPTRTVAAGAH